VALEAEIESDSSRAYSGNAARLRSLSHRSYPPKARNAAAL
jgi:hypothetical protein